MNISHLNFTLGEGSGSSLWENNAVSGTEKSRSEKTWSKFKRMSKSYAVFFWAINFASSFALKMPTIAITQMLF